MLSTADQAQRLEEIDRRLSKESLYYLCKSILGYSLISEEPHMDVCQFGQTVIFQKPPEKFGNQAVLLDMEPRGSLKTTIFSQGLPIQAILNNPNIRILLDSAVEQNSLDNLKVITQHLERNPKLRYLYGDFKSSQWKIDDITIAQRTQEGLKEPTLRASGIGKSQTGFHYDLIISDDPVNRENVATPESRKKVKDHIKYMFSILDPGGWLVVVGTQWHYEDVYRDLRDPEKYPECVKRIQKASSLGMTAGKLYFPNRLTRAFLEGQLRRQGRAIFSAQMDNDPAPEGEDADFPRRYFRPYKRDELPKDIYSFIAIDPGGKKKGSDKWVMMLGHCSALNETYFDRMLSGNWKTSKAWDLLFAWVAQHNPLSVGLETTGGQKYLEDGLLDEMRRRGVYFNLRALTHAIVAKHTRIKAALQPRYEAAAIYHSSDMGPLEDQLVRIPKGEDDIADTAAMIIEIQEAPRPSKVRVKHHRTIDEQIRLAAKGRLDEQRVHPVLGTEW